MEFGFVACNIVFLNHVKFVEVSTKFWSYKPVPVMKYMYFMQHLYSCCAVGASEMHIAS